MNTNPIGKNNPLVLASRSPRRKELLGQIGIPFESVESGVEEAARSSLLPSEFACRIAALKAESVSHIRPHQWILGADTIVVMENRVFGKPRDIRQCWEMLLSLSGKNHKVITGFCLVDPGGVTVHVEAVTTRVKVKKMSEDEIEAYIKTGEPFGKAGGYAIQAIGSFMIEHIDGSYTNVVGLPVCEVINAMITCGALKVFPLWEVS
ncbi:MAG: septum formation protein Maf [Deltaproteobacteria bacterium]|nr:septum formation protein Maf [Deltaproteobacteria bacterium]MBW2309730.1 septum formation protein Maf [Deltaproteobacteria bacterium]